ncbi:AAA family ATPase [Piscinibacter sakaiensis]|uniref:AAA family ATPase n=1 Tax=Piscinibacter sakaiensis TaxID=1547922 RepID=UPI003AAE0A7D
MTTTQSRLPAGPFPRHRAGLRSVAVFSQKGGSGKSTVAIHLAVMASRGHRVLLVDADPQGTVAAWGASRTRPAPMIVRADPTNLVEVITSAQRENFEIVVVDCPPHAVAGTAALLRLVDHVITPVQPTMPDIAATKSTVAMVTAAGKPISFVINRAPPRAAEVVQAREALSPLGPVSPITLGDRRAYARALTDNLAVSECARGDDKAVAEVLRYWIWLDGHFLEVDTWQRRRAA